MSNNIIENEFLRLRKLVIEKEFKNMNDMQKKCVFTINGPVLVLAGAGSGKTTVLINRIVNMIKFGNAYNSSEIQHDIDEEDIEELNNFLNNDEVELSFDIIHKMSVDSVKPWNILAVTFTNKAANELKTRLYNVFGDAGKDVFASTFHSMCLNILRRNADKIGFSNSFTIYDPEDCKKVIKECLEDLKIDNDLIPIKQISSKISNAKNKMILSDEYVPNNSFDPKEKVIADVYKLYQRKLKLADAMDFDDLLVYTVILLKNNQDVLTYYRNKFQYVMIDEYQDTNLVQDQIVNLLVSEHKNICIVGDDDQSIYKFRGANIENIMNFEKKYKETRLIRLEQNYRSTKTILEAANCVIGNNLKRKGKTLWTQNSNGEKISVYNASDEYGEANYIANTINNEVEAGKKFSDFAILYRLNAQSNTIERVFTRTGIPYKIIGGLRFYDHKEIKDIMAYLQLISNHNDSVRLKRIINYPKRGIGKKTISIVEEIAENQEISMFEVMEKANEFSELKKAASKLIEFTNLISYLSNSQLKASELYNLLLEKVDFLQELREEKDNSETRIENVMELLSNIKTYEEENKENASLSGFLEEVSLLSDIDKYNESADYVVLMTVHSSKGLEFPVVFLPGFEDGIFPSRMSMNNEENLEEERRLAYVAITRAKEKLIILHAEKRTIFGCETKNQSSKFLNEIPDKLLKLLGNQKILDRCSDNVKLKHNKNDNSRDRNIVSSRTIGIHFTNNVYDNVEVGDRISHKIFGEGLVVDVQKTANDALLEIKFDSGATKKLLRNTAKVRKI